MDFESCTYNEFIEKSNKCSKFKLFTKVGTKFELFTKIGTKFAFFPKWGPKLHLHFVQT